MSLAVDGSHPYSISQSFQPRKDNFSLPKNTTLIETITSSKTKKFLNYFANGSSSVSSLITFLNGNFKWFDSIQEKLESLSEVVSKTALTTIGFVGSVDLWQKKNPVTFLGYALLVPISLLSKGYDSWVARGFSYGACNAVVVIDRREVVDDSGEPILDKNGKVQTLSGDFSDKGWWNGFTTTFKECGKMLKELYKKPSRISNFSHATLVASLFQMLGPIPGLFGYKTIEATIRDVSSALGDTALLLDKDSKNQDTSTQKQNKLQSLINLKSPIVQSSLLWICTSVIDLLKRFDFISNNINNLTELSSFFDRTASIRFTQGVLHIKKSH